MTHSAPRQASDFTDAVWKNYLDSVDIPHLNAWMKQLADRGIDFYLRRIDAIDFTGERVLDAGCGVGNWSLALARRFSIVDAIDYEHERVKVLNGIAQQFLPSIRTATGSITSLPYDDELFDAIFCNGVVFLTGTEIALSEMRRTLKPGGKIYVSYNSPEWWRHLIRDRAPTEPDCYVYGANGLITWAFQLAAQLFLRHKPSTDDCRAAMQALKHDNDLAAQLDVARQTLKRLSATPNAHRPASDLLDCITDLSTTGIDETYRARIAKDLLSWIANDVEDHEILADTYTFRPEDMTALLSQTGLVNVQSAHEGCLHLNPDAPQARPIYTRSQGVYESVAIAPDR